MNILFVLAHNDDEYFCALRMQEEIRLGNHVFIAYLTYGGIQGENPDVRISESIKVLRKFGIDETDILLIGSRKSIFDLHLHERSVDACQDLDELLKNTAIECIYVMAWEGGHPDHDASHMIGVAFARKRNLQSQIFEFPAYSRFHVMTPLQTSSALLATKTSRMDALKTLASGFSYKTQRGTFIAMLPGSIVQLLVFGYQNYWRVPNERNYRNPPHAGRLFYERRFNISFQEFSRNLRALGSLMSGDP
ncbi:MAG: PIG-L deacetylase family protein [Gammaproteobacteria bacterium]